MARVVRLLLAGPMGLISALLIVCALMLPGGCISQVPGERALHEYMGRVADGVIDFRKKSGRPPSEPELNKIAEQVAAGEDVRLFSFWERRWEFEESLGHAPEDGFVLTFWRGEWSEAYASWNGKSTVETSWLATGLGFASMGLVFGGGGVFAGFLTWVLLPPARGAKRCDET